MDKNKKTEKGEKGRNQTKNVKTCATSFLQFDLEPGMNIFLSNLCENKNSTFEDHRIPTFLTQFLHYLKIIFISSVFSVLNIR